MNVLLSSSVLIQFIDPITGEGTQNSKPEYDPVNRPWKFSCIPDEPGVYIWGMKVTVNGIEYFAPWCVGEGKIRTRLAGHYKRLCPKGDSNEELFDFSASIYSVDRIQELYGSMCVYDVIVNHAPQNAIKLSRAATVPNLIFWNDQHFMPTRFGLPTIGPPKQGSKTSDALNQLCAIGTARARQMLNQIQDCKANFNNGFYFLYALKVDGIKTTQMEHAAKNALKSAWIYTTAKAQGAYPSVIIQLPSRTDLIHDLWSPPGLRTITVPKWP